MDKYTIQTFNQQYLLHQNYQKERMKILPIVKVRMAGIPEDISENAIKFILHINGDTTSRWNNKTGDLFSEKEGKQECKCFTSSGPISFTPSSNWDILYCLDARQWTDNKFILYRINLSKNSEEWKNIKVSQKQTFDNQAKQGRRPRITWDALFPQISQHYEKIFEGNIFDLVINPLLATEELTGLRLDE